MKKLALLLALLFAQNAEAVVYPTTFPPLASFRSSDRTKHVAILKPSRWDILFAPNVASTRLNLTVNLGTIRETMESNGLEVHEYDTNFFEIDGDHRLAWTDLGQSYAFVIVLWPNNNVASFARYVCADSTNAQIVVVGGSDAGAGKGWADGDSTIRGFVDSFSGFRDGTSAGGSALCTYDNRDTMWSAYVASGKRLVALPSGVTNVKRVLKLLQLGAGKFVNTHLDSLNANMPAGTDSVALANEYLGPLWKVTFDTYSGQGKTSGVGAGQWLNSRTEAGLSSPTEVYWLKTPGGNFSARTYPQLLWSLVCRYTTARPIKWSYDWDDVTDKFADNQGQPPRWRKTAIDSTLAGLAAFGIKPTTMVNPGHMAAYLNGTKPTYEVAWSGSAHSYLNTMTWVHHAHDSTQASITSNLVGGFGGYSSGNGANATEAGNLHQLFGYRFANYRNPTLAATAGAEGYGLAGARWGILQRLQYSDSLRWALAPTMTRPPYLAFPANEMLPKNWKARAGATGWASYVSDANYLCSIDSVLWAYDYALNGGKTTGVGTIYLRSANDNPRGISAAGGYTPLGAWTQFDRDSVVATNLFLYPGQRYVVRVGARTIQAVCVNSFLQGAAPRSQYIVDANFRTAYVLGLKNPVNRAEFNDPNLGETFNADANTVFDSPGGILKDFDGRMATRVVYQHPGQHGDTNTANGDYHVDVFIRSMATQMRIMDTIAGRPTQKCVPAWMLDKP